NVITNSGLIPSISLMSTYISTYFISTAYECNSLNYDASCQSLVNMCVMAGYEKSSAPCSLVQAISRNRRRNSGIGINSDIPVLFPWLYVRLLSGDTISTLNSYTSNIQLTLPKQLKIVFFRYSLNGTFLGILPMTSKGFGCIDSEFQLYLDILDDDGNYQPILIKPLSMSVNNNAYSEDDVYVRRFVPIDSITGLSSSTALTKYVSIVTIEFNVDWETKTLKLPIMTLTYSVTSASVAMPATLTIDVIYKSDDTNTTSVLAIVATIVSVMLVCSWLYSLYIWGFRMQRNGIIFDSEVTRALHNVLPLNDSAITTTFIQILLALVITSAFAIISHFYKSVTCSILLLDWEGKEYPCAWYNE
ncbi:hypothetical protein ROZALSC1DRAFT_26705, partial [Rozella allomycis CSF55]